MNSVQLVISFLLQSSFRKFLSVFFWGGGGLGMYQWHLHSFSLDPQCASTPPSLFIIVVVVWSGGELP